MDGKKKKQGREKAKLKRRYRAMAHGSAKKMREGKNVLQESMRGFLIFCNHRERDAVREAYALLNEFSKEESSEEEEGDLEAELAKEKDKIMTQEKRFQLCYSAGVANLIFVKSTVDPLPLSSDIINAILSDGKQRTRHVLRLLPIQTVCKAFVSPIKDSVIQLLQNSGLSSESKTYCVVFNTRYNNNLTRIDAMESVNEAVKSVTQGKWKVLFKNPDYAIVLEIVTSFCCLGILPDFFQRKKYNLIELAKIKTSSMPKGEMTDNLKLEEEVKENSDVKESSILNPEPVNELKENLNLTKKLTDNSD